jgi:hypothetical protein
LLRAILPAFFLSGGGIWTWAWEHCRYSFFTTHLFKDPRYQGPQTGYVPPQFVGEGAKESLDKFKHQNHTVPNQNLLDQAISRVIDKMSRVWSSVNSEPLTFDDALYGNECVDALPADTSPGWPWTDLGYKTKGDVCVSDESREQIERDWDNLDSPDYVPTGWSINLKDELRPVAKAHKPRAFMGGPIEMVIHGKRLFGQQDAAIASHPLSSPVRVGFTPFHGGMRALWRKHCKYSYHWDGDYHNWDGSVPPWLFEACMRVRMRYLSPCVWQRVWNYYRVLCFAAMIDPRSTLFEKFGGMPSGTYTTATDNSIMNAIVLEMFAITQKAELEVSVYGDDNLVSTNDNLDIGSIREFMLTLGLDYTSAEKDGPPYFKQLVDCTFLKCQFSHDACRYPWRDWQRIFAVLEWTKSLDHDIYISRLNSCLLLAYGTTAYEYVRRAANKIGDLDPYTRGLLLTDLRVREVALGDWKSDIAIEKTFDGEFSLN